MPLVKVLYRAPFDKELVERLGDELPAIVANALTCVHSDGKLTPDDVEVDVEPMPAGMRSDYDLHVEVEANDYPDRKASLDERWAQINDGVRTFFGGRLHLEAAFRATPHHPPKGWVWIKLFPAKWGDIWPTPPEMD